MFVFIGIYDIIHRNKKKGEFSDGKRIPFHDVAYEEADFNVIGNEFESIYKDDGSIFRFGKVGNAACRLINQRAFVDFAVDWMNKNRI